VCELKAVIIIAIAVGVGILGFFILFIGLNMFDQGILLGEVDDVRLASLQSNYYYEDDRLVVNVILTNKDGEHTKANGHVELSVLKDGRPVYSNEYDFTKDDFLSWQTIFGGEFTGYRIDIKEYFSSGEHDVYVDMVLKSDRYWEDLHDTFYSLEQARSDIELEEPVRSDIELEEPESTNIISQECSGTARCITGTVTSIIDGDTIKVDGQTIRFALASAPELNEFNGPEARDFIENLCPVGSTVLVDEDDGRTEGSFGRILGVIHCNGVNLDEELLDADLGDILLEHCSTSEFADDYWAVKHGCTTSSESSETIQVPKVTTNDCDPSYPDFCIPPPPPDLDCKDIPQKKFTVLQPDPHRFDGDKNGVGCES